MLLTRAPVAGGSASTAPLPLDLHVLSLSLAFILSQDQTLRCCYIFSDLLFFFVFNCRRLLRLTLLPRVNRFPKKALIPGSELHV